MTVSRSRPVRSNGPSKRGELRKPYAVWLVTLFAFLLPGSGQMLNGSPVRGISMQFFMLFFGFITYQLSGPEISPVGRFAGGIAVYVISVLDANAIARRRSAAWRRIEEEEAGRRGSRTASAGSRGRAGRKPAKSAGSPKHPPRSSTPRVRRSVEERDHAAGERSGRKRGPSRDV